MLQLRLYALILLAGFAATTSASETDELRSTLPDQVSVAVTIYNENLALIKDQRRIRIMGGQSRLAFCDVSARIRPETALLRSLTDHGRLLVTEQNFDFDLLTPQKMLEKYVGKTVGIIRTNPATGIESSEKGLVLSANNGVVLKIGDRIETGIPGRIVYSDVPSNLRDRPTLVMSINNDGAVQQEVELSYLTGGLEWKADYVMELNESDDRFDLSGWVTLTNTSGTTYRNARLQLVAGDVNQARIEYSQPAGLTKGVTMAAMAEETLLEYHLYTLDRPATIAENQTKQVSLLSAAGVPVRKELVLQGADYYYQGGHGDLGQKMKVGVFVEFDNKESAGLGLPLPRGVIRVYKKDGAGNAQFVGEDSIDHTPKNKNVRLKLGNAFDVTANRKQTDFRKLPNPARSREMFESAYETLLKNARKEAVTVTVQEPIPADWKMIEESHKHVKAASNTAVWKIKVPAEGSAILSYRVLVCY